MSYKNLASYISTPNFSGSPQTPRCSHTIQLPPSGLLGPRGGCHVAFSGCISLFPAKQFELCCFISVVGSDPDWFKPGLLNLGTVEHFGLANFFVGSREWGCSVPCRILSSISGLFTLDVSHTHSPIVTPCLQASPNDSWWAK